MWIFARQQENLPRSAGKSAGRINILHLALTPHPVTGRGGGVSWSTYTPHYKRRIKTEEKTKVLLFGGQNVFISMPC